MYNFQHRAGGLCGILTQNHTILGLSRNLLVFCPMESILLPVYQEKLTRLF